MAGKKDSQEERQKIAGKKDRQEERQKIAGAYWPCISDPLFLSLLYLFFISFLSLFFISFLFLFVCLGVSQCCLQGKKKKRSSCWY